MDSQRSQILKAQIRTAKINQNSLENSVKFCYKCVYLNAKSIVNKRNELRIVIEDIDPHVIGITESWATTDISDSELRMTGYVMFRKDRIGRREVALFYILTNPSRLTK